MSINPWDIIGWAIVGLFVCALTIGLVTMLSRGVALSWRRFRSRNISLAVGQVWNQDGYELQVVDRFMRNDNREAFGIKSGAMSFSETQDEWKKRKKNRRIYLVGGPKQ